MQHIHRRVVRVGAAAAWFAAALFMVVGFLSDSDDLILEAVGAVSAASLMTALILLKRESAGIAMVGSAFVVMAWYSVNHNAKTIVAAAVAMVIICAIAMLFVDRARKVVMGAVAAFLLVAPQFWNMTVFDGLLLGTVMTVSFILTAVIFISVRNSATTIDARFQMLFEHSPTAVLEEDWSEALAYIRSEYTGRPDRLLPFLMAYPAVVRRAVSKARIVRVNAAAVELLEADGPEELLGARDGDKLPPETLPAFVGALVALYEGRAAFEQEVPALTMRGRPLWVLARGVGSSPGSPASTLLIGLADITHIKARQEAMAELVRAKDQFVAKVSHELRTPLTAVLGLTQEMTGDHEMSDSEHAELMRLVAGQAREMSYIVEDLLVAARAETGGLAVDSTVVDMTEAVNATLEGLALRVDEIPETIPSAVGDPSRVRQVLRNLLTNAERYGGSERRIVAGETPHSMWIEVRDNGDGVSSKDGEHIFEPYGTAHSGVSGSMGLGLSVSRQLAELMGGSLVYRRDGDETVFRLELPLAHSPEPALTSRPTST